MGYETERYGPAPAKTGGHGEVQLGRHDVREVIDAEGGLVGINALELLRPIVISEVPSHHFTIFREMEVGQAIDAPAMAQPMAGANVIGMGIVGIPGLNRLLGRKEALLGFG